MVPVAAHQDSIPSDYAEHYTAYKENAQGVPLVDGTTIKTCFDACGANPQEVKTFVTLSKDLAQFPPTYIATCGKDPLRDDGKVLDMMLKKEGVKTTHNHYAGMPHCFWMMPGVKGGEEFLEDVLQGTQWVLSQ
jgi:versiconal hemiacetal acetate esterase